ncbi:Protein Y23H5A.3 [Aphelenchoides avenae]|nr:Protein Y23H5A.3 [Aphelenchus avenae]
MTALKWGMVCSVPEEQALDTFREFGEWLTQTLEKNAGRLNLTHRFQRNATFVLQCMPDDKNSLQKTYEKIRNSHADVLYVIHILPKPNSMEFGMLKQLCALNAIVGQGILAEKAISRFEGADIGTVVDHLNQFISLRLAQLTSRHRDENTYRMYVRGQTNASRDVQQDDFTEEVTRVLHKSSQQSPTKKLEELEYDDRVVCVSGFPLSFDESQVLSIFGRFIPRFVRWLADGVAVVEFENWIQAAQAVALHHRKAFRSGQLLVIPCDTQVARIARELMCPVDPEVSDEDLGEIHVEPVYTIVSRLEGAGLSDDASDSLSEVSDDLSTSDGELSDATVVEVVRQPLTVQGQ